MRRLQSNPSRSKSLLYGQNCQRGALIPVLALSLAVVMIAGLIIAGVATESSKRAHAQAAADATALAGAAGGESSAVRMAHKYSADLLLFTIDGSTVSVVLLVDGIESHAHADRHLVATGRG